MTVARSERWSPKHRLALGTVLLAGAVIRVLLLPSDGLRGDLDQFVGWVHDIATKGLGALYRDTTAGPVSFGPVMAYVWAVLAGIQPAFATVTDAADPAIRILMKLPASIADFGLAALVAFTHRDRARWAVLGAAAILLHPAVFYVSAWWGQYESIYVLFGVAATVAAINGRNGLAAALVAISLLTKPQAVAFVVPFAAWFWAVGYRQGGTWGGVLGIGRAAAIGVIVMIVLWLPFVAFGGPSAYLDSLRHYQDEVFNALSLRAWNIWWLLQEVAAAGSFIADDIPFLGPLTLRHFGYAVTAGLSIVLGAAILRDPRPQTLILGLAASVLVVYTFMTQMHERYAFGALVVLALLLADARTRAVWVTFGIVFFVNLLAAIPPTTHVAAGIPVAGPFGVLGSIALTLCTVALLLLTMRPATLAGDDASGHRQ